ncbi:hypothetical protein DE146DRAFT_472595 [Phaeosphaeria sp. MPI-PUGE-AT-0046c]|nr:hypothetical protein DE146DRAFT_472595 [Phaeosphaeria sp. MPI-PUGE-AT-0046c]
MADNIEPNADLAKILATLASLQQLGGIAAQGAQQGYEQPQSYPGYSAYTEHVQTYPPPQSNPYPPTADPRLQHRPVTQNLSTTPKPQDRVSTPLIDPATITEWKQGLRCVSKIAQHNPEFAASIRKLMKDQEGNVKQWETGRKVLIEDHKLKRENEATHRAALYVALNFMQTLADRCRSLPGLLEGTPLLRTPEREQEELGQYDAKVYRACKAMTEAQSSSLKVLGVPFFGTRPHLILHETEEPDTKLGDDTHQNKARVGDQKITKKQLLELQRKMLNHLLELYGD